MTIFEDARDKIFEKFIWAVPPLIFYIVNYLPLPSYITAVIVYILLVKYTMSYIKTVKCSKDSDEEIRTHAIKATSMYIPLILLSIANGYFQIPQLGTVDMILNNIIAWTIISYKFFNNYMDKMTECKAK